jgi:hypothetical protein
MHDGFCSDDCHILRVDAVYDYTAFRPAGDILVMGELEYMLLGTGRIYRDWRVLGRCVPVPEQCTANKNDN